MNRQVVLVLGFLLALAGCGQIAPRQDIVVKVNDYEVTKERFEMEFRESVFGQLESPESRQQFLNTLIDRKLILQDAQAKGLDKDPAFLRMIEKFWEQSLLKIALEKKTREIAESGVVQGQGGGNTPTAAGTQAISDWMTGLQKTAVIEVHKDLINHQ